MSSALIRLPDLSRLSACIAMMFVVASPVEITDDMIMDEIELPR
jgi:hypothetical protein